MSEDLKLGAKEIFQFKQMLEKVVTASLNTPGEYMDKIFPIYEEIVELVQSFKPFTLKEFKNFVSQDLVKYDAQPFFPVLGGMYVNALINKLFEYGEKITLNLNELCFQIVEDASKDATNKEQTEKQNEVGFSLDLLGFLMHQDKELIIIGPVGDYCGALMGKNSKLTIEGIHGKHLGYEKADSAEIFIKNN
mgnify:CR=1 FL=1